MQWFPEASAVTFPCRAPHDCRGGTTPWRIALSGALLALALTGNPADAFSLTAVQSRKIQGAAGAVDLPVDTRQGVGGALTVEPRSAGAGHQVVFQFDSTLFSFTGVTVLDEEGAAINSWTVTNSNTEIVVTLAGVPDRKRVTVRVTDVNSAGFDVIAALGFLVGDVDNSRSVSAADTLQVKSRSGRLVDRSNFTSDVNLSGLVSAADILAVKGRVGSSLLPARTLGGTVSGLSGTVVLMNAGAKLAVASNGTFTFFSAVATGANYNVTVASQPAGQICTVANGFGTVPGGGVSNIAVTCVQEPLACATQVLQSLVSAGSFNQNVAPQCTGSPTTCCPGGVAQAACGPMLHDLVAQSGDLPRLVVAEPPAQSRIDATLRVRLRSVASLPIGISLVGDCLLSVDSAPGPAADVQFDFPVSRVIDPNDGLSKLSLGTISLTKLTADDVALGGNIGCLVVNLGTSYYVQILTSVFTDAISSRICNSCPCR